MPSDATRPSRQDQAAAWFAAERAGVMLVEQRAEFEAWRSDPRNQAALDAMRELWADLAVLKGNEPAPPKVAKHRSLVPMVAAVAAILVAGFVATSLLLAPSDKAIVTAEGQQTTESMPDGSVVAVNVASNVTYRFTDTQRLVTLENGEAAFSVKPDPAKPFVVRVGDLEIRAVGTSFNVRERDGTIQVAVSEGRVELCRIAKSGEELSIAYLDAGELLKLPSSIPREMQIASPVAVPPSQVSEWRMRIVTYEDATVKEVVEDLNRYFEQKLVVEEPSLLSRRITIRLRVDNRDRAIETLANLLEVKVLSSRGGEVLRE